MISLPEITLTITNEAGKRQRIHLDRKTQTALRQHIPELRPKVQDMIEDSISLSMHLQDAEWDALLSR